MSIISEYSNSRNSGFLKTRLKIIGFGNILMGDDGIGIRVIEELKNHSIIKNLENIEIIDGGTSGVDLIFFLQQSDKVIIIDAVDAGQAEDEVICFNYNDIKQLPEKELKSFSLHDMDLSEIFKLVKSLKINTDVVVIGIKPKFINFGDKLSSTVKTKIPEIISKIIQEIENFYN